MSKNNSRSLSAVIGVMAIFMITQIAFVVTPAMASLAAQYHEVPYTTFLLIASIATAGQTIFSLISGPVAGTKIKYKTLLVISILMVIVGALIPTFVHSFTVLCVARFIAGAGVGFSAPVGASVVMRTFEGKKAANLMGLGQTVTNLCGVVYQTVSGILCVINIKYMWYLHLVLIIPLLLIIFLMPEPEKIEASPKKEVEADAPKASIGIRGILVIFGYGIMFMMFYPFMIDISAVVAAEHLGNAATAGIILSAYSAGGVASLVFGPLYNAFKGKTLVISIIAEAIGMGIAAYAMNLTLLIVGMFLCGLAIFVLMSACLTDVGKDLAPATMNRFSSLFVVGLSLGSVLGAPFINVVSKINSAVRFPITVGFYGTVILAVIWIILNFYFAKKTVVKRSNA